MTTIATLTLECRAVEYAADGKFTASNPCGHQWTERLGEYPMQFTALVKRLEAACYCPKCGTRGKVYALAPADNI